MSVCEISNTEKDLWEPPTVTATELEDTAGGATATTESNSGLFS